MTRRSRRRSARDSKDVYVAKPWALYAAILFCLGFAGVGAVDFVSSLAPWFWKAVPCEVMRFVVDDQATADPPFTAQVCYRFEWQGSSHESTCVGIAGWKHATAPLALSRYLEENPKTECYLPDGLAEDAVLLRPPQEWAGLFFVGFGGCIGWILVQANRTRDLSQEEITRKILPPVALLFGTPGLAMTLGMSLPVWIETMEVRDWIETPSTVVWSEVRTTGGKRPTSHPDICYEYQAAGRIWRNSRIRPGGASGFDRTSVGGLMSSHPAGFRTRCYVHPTRPERAVLLTSPGWAGLFTLFPLPFLAIGLLCVREVIRSRSLRLDEKASRPVLPE